MVFYRVALVVLLLSLVGCQYSPSTMTNVSFRGQAIAADGAPLANVLVVLQPIENGYEIELQTDAEGRFAGEGVPGKYVFYFNQAPKSKLPDGIPPAYREPTMEHLVSVAGDDELVCQIRL